MSLAPFIPHRSVCFLRKGSMGSQTATEEMAAIRGYEIESTVMLGLGADIVASQNSTDLCPSRALTLTGDLPLIMR